MTEELEHKLGTLIFNGTILFLSISFGLFALGAGRITISSVIAFILFVIIMVLLGIGALIASFYGIKNKNMNLIYTAGILFIIMVVVLTITYVQVYISNISQEVTLVVNK